MTDYYVRPSGGSYGNEDGSDYANAWDGFTNINWATVDAGDGKLFVAGTHYETMTVGASGEAGVPIQIVSCTIANGATNDDPATIDGSATRYYGIQINSQTYITIDGITIQNCLGRVPGIGNNACIEVTGSNCTVKNCTLYCNTSRGIDVEYAQNFTLQNTLIDSTATDTANENDLLFFWGGGGGSPGHIIGGEAGKGNHFYQRTIGSSLYIDGIQTYNEDGPMEVSYNYFQDESPGGGNNMLIQIERGSGQYNIYNNIIMRNNPNDNQAPVICDTDGTMVFEHNTVVNLIGFGINQLSGTLQARNNIFYAGTRECYSSTNAPPAGWPNNNLYYHLEGPTHSIGADPASHNWAQWAEQYETAGDYGDPLFTNLAGRDFTLQGGSPAIGLGDARANLNIGPSDDYLGNPRDATTPDVGAHEYQLAGVVMPIAMAYYRQRRN